MDYGAVVLRIRESTGQVKSVRCEGWPRSSRLVICARRSLSSRLRAAYAPSVPDWSSTAEFVTVLVGADNVRQPYADVDAMAKRGEAGALLELAIALERMGQPAGVERWVLEAVFDRIASSLALHPSRDNARAAIELLGVERMHSTQLPWQPYKAARRAASLLAQGQPPDSCFELAPTVSTSLGTEAMACWIQELVIRGVAMTAVDTIVRFWNGLRSAGHPLAHLPLARASIEESLADMLWKDAVNGSARSSSAPVSNRDESKASLVPAFHLERLPTPGDLCAAAENWLDESNGRSDGGVFRLDERVGELRSGHLARLPLECVSNANSIQVEAITPGIAASHLFSAAATGGAYNRGRGAAYGRRDLWRSLAALVGADATASLQEIERASQACQFYAVTIDSQWMYSVAWDLALACVREDGRTFAIVVATDTD